MRRRPLLWLGILLAMGLVLALAFPTSQYMLIGLLQNEAFYDGKPTNYWISALQKRGYFGSEGPPRDVGNILSKAGAAAVPVLVDMLQDEDDDVRFHALLALLAMKPGEAAAAAPALARAMFNEKTGFHRNLAYWAFIKADEERAIRWFIGMLEHREKNRVLAASALGDLGPRARAAADALRVALDDEDRDVSVAAARALWKIERHVDTKLLLTLAQGEEPVCGRSPFSMPGIGGLGGGIGGFGGGIGGFGGGIGGLSGGFGGIGGFGGGLGALGRGGWRDLGPQAQGAVPGLLQALQSPDETIRLSATVALGHMSPSIVAKEAMWALVARLKDDSMAVRRGAVCALGQMGPKAAEAVPALIEALQDADKDIRLAAASSLGNIGPVARTAVPHLGRAVKDAEVAVRRTAADALGWIGPAAKAAVPDLIEALKDKDEYTRSNAAQALGRIGPVAKTVIPGLIAALHDESVPVRRWAAYALAEIGLAQAPIP